MQNSYTTDQNNTLPRQVAGRYDGKHTGAQGLIQPKNMGTKMQDLAVTNQNDTELSLIEQVVVQGDLSKLNPAQRVMYYKKVCESAGLNPFTRPFDYIILNGKLTLYAKKDATEQLRKINGISIENLETIMMDDIYIVKAYAKTNDGRTDAATGAVTIGNLKGDAKANAIMKAETKAKRRVTLSISGLGWVDETEIETIPGAKKVLVDIDTGTIDMPRITEAQAVELQMILDDCSKDYQAIVYRALDKQYGISDVKELAPDLYPRVKEAAIRNMEEARKKAVTQFPAEQSVFEGV